MLREIESAELSEWMAYERIEPFGQRRGDYQAAVIAQTVARCAGNKNTKLEDFLLDFKPARPPQSEAVKQNLLDTFFKSLG